jgi:endonuclease III
MEARVPDDLMDSMHRLPIAHGREVCTACSPNCATSPPCRRFCADHENVIENGGGPKADDRGRD